MIVQVQHHLNLNLQKYALQIGYLVFVMTSQLFRVLNVKLVVLNIELVVQLLVDLVSLEVKLGMMISQHLLVHV